MKIDVMYSRDKITWKPLAIMLDSPVAKALMAECPKRRHLGRPYYEYTKHGQTHRYMLPAPIDLPSGIGWSV